MNDVGDASAEAAASEVSLVGFGAPMMASNDHLPRSSRPVPPSSSSPPSTGVLERDFFMARLSQPKPRTPAPQPVTPAGAVPGRSPRVSLAQRFWFANRESQEEEKDDAAQLAEALTVPMAGETRWVDCLHLSRLQCPLRGMLTTWYNCLILQLSCSAFGHCVSGPGGPE